MINWMAIRRSINLALGTGLLLMADQAAADIQNPNQLEIREVVVDGKVRRWQPGGELNLGAFPQNISFSFGPQPDASPGRTRLIFKLDGYDETWREGSDYMSVTIRFYNEAGDRVAQQAFTVIGNSTGWNGTLEGSPLIHRRETLTVPPGATRLWVVISSAGPPALLGVYVVEDLVVCKVPSSSRKPEVLLRSPFEDPTEDFSTNQAPREWERDGTRPSMAKIVEVGHDPTTKAFAIVDDDPGGHAEWHLLKNFAPRVNPGDNLIVEWNEMFSVGVSDKRSTGYTNLPPGVYRFRVAEASIFGKPTGVEISLAVRVPPPYWEMPWFWILLTALAVGLAATGARYLAWRKMKRQMVRLEQQHVLERERVRIAQDIHDDLGARVTQISLLSGMARQDLAFSDKARAEFHQISLVAQDLVGALYETVWAVNPENDNLDAMGNYLCQRVNELCTLAQLRCRLHVSLLPRQIEVSSLIRHNISMAAKEAVHNIIKHARATEVILHLTFDETLLTVAIQDNGCGFQKVEKAAGHGLVNMRRRMESIGGSFQVESSRGRGTMICFRLAIKSSGKASTAVTTSRPPLPKDQSAGTN